MADFLLELLSEEIPARMQKGARAELEKLMRRELENAGVAVGEVTVFSTPRRLALIARDLPLETKAVREEAKGPPMGAPDKAVEGFCRKNGIEKADLETREVKGRETYFAVIEKPGQAVADVLAAAIPAIIADFSWPKSMRWGAASISSESTRWVRPLSGIVALLDGEVVPVVMDGIASGRETLGHRFHSSGPITITAADSYADALMAAKVIVDQEKRAGIIREAARKAARAVGLTVIEDEGLVVENAGLTEWPVPLLGRFDEAFLDVPPEVIQLTARVNQKYFVCEESGLEGTRLANAFICTANIEAKEPAVVVDGNRKVLAARLADARFFWEQDQKTKLAEHAKGLERITFHEKLGTVADKVERVAKLARWLCEEGIVDGDADMAEQAARLCKADLVTEMVGEFPELQGLMGGYYAEKERLPREVSDAIRDHYKPVGQGDDVPTAPVTVAVSLADKLDTLVGFFAIGQRPSGSKDPFALRRAAIAITKLVASNNLRFSVHDAIAVQRLILIRSLHRHFDFVNGEEVDMESSYVGVLIVEKLDDISPELFVYPKFDDHLVDFERNIHLGHLHEGAYFEIPSLFDLVLSVSGYLHDRLEDAFRKEGVRVDIVRSLISKTTRRIRVNLGAEFGGERLVQWKQRSLSTEDDLVRLLARVHALQSFVETEDGANLLAGYKRAANILKKEDWSAPAAPAETGEEDPLALAGKPEFDEVLRAKQNLDGKSLSYTPEKAEKDLIDALDTAQPKAAAAIGKEDFAAAMEALAALRSPIDAFFEDVTVNDEDPAKREARLDLLARFTSACGEVADFSRIEG